MDKKDRIDRDIEEDFHRTLLNKPPRIPPEKAPPDSPVALVVVILLVIGALVSLWHIL